MSLTLPEEEITFINILAVLEGHNYVPTVDPYYAVEDWHEAARGDGHSYNGVLDTIQRLQNETLEQLLARARQRARELEDATD
jgi:hypothetical protein